MQNRFRTSSQVRLEVSHYSASQDEVHEGGEAGAIEESEPRLCVRWASGCDTFSSHAGREAEPLAGTVHSAVMRTCGQWSTSRRAHMPIGI